MSSSSLAAPLVTLVSPALRRYMVLDLKRFTPGRDLPPGLLWVRGLHHRTRPARSRAVCGACGPVVQQLQLRQILEPLWRGAAGVRRWRLARSGGGADPRPGRGGGPDENPGARLLAQLQHPLLPRGTMRPSHLLSTWHVSCACRRLRLRQVVMAPIGCHVGQLPMPSAMLALSFRNYN